MSVDWKFRKERWEAYHLGKRHAQEKVPFDSWKFEHKGIQQAYSDGYEFGKKLT